MTFRWGGLLTFFEKFRRVLPGSLWALLVLAFVFSYWGLWFPNFVLGTILCVSSTVVKCLVFAALGSFTGKACPEFFSQSPFPPLEGSF